MASEDVPLSKSTLIGALLLQPQRCKNEADFQEEMSFKNKIKSTNLTHRDAAGKGPAAHLQVWGRSKKLQAKKILRVMSQDSFNCGNCIATHFFINAQQYSKLPEWQAVLKGEKCEKFRLLKKYIPVILSNPPFELEVSYTKVFPAALTGGKNWAHCLLNKVSGNKCTLHLLCFSSHCSHNNEQMLSQDPEDYISHLL